MKELITQIENHLAVCAPHIKEGEQCQLLIKALERLKFLEEESKFLHTGIGQIKNDKEELKSMLQLHEHNMATSLYDDDAFHQRWDELHEDIVNRMNESGLFEHIKKT